jgi:hypothetical protein
MSADAQNADSNDTAAPQPQMQFMPFQPAGVFGCESVAVVRCFMFAQSALLAGWLDMAVSHASTSVECLVPRSKT